MIILLLVDLNSLTTTEAQKSLELLFSKFISNPQPRELNIEEVELTILENIPKYLKIFKNISNARFVRTLKSWAPRWLSNYRVVVKPQDQPPASLSSPRWWSWTLLRTASTTRMIESVRVREKLLTI